MVSFVVYDLTFLVLFSLFITWFLYKNRAKLGREAKVMFLYRTQMAVKWMKDFGRNFSGLLWGLKYVIIVVGFLLMAGVLWLIGRTVYLYVAFPQLVNQVTRAPPIAPVIPYFPQLFGLESFFPPFYFTYFIVALAIVAFVHEFSHGIYMVLNKVRIKSTGIVFLGPILGAFVEQDDKDMNKISKTNQMSILGAGVFANVIIGLLFLLLWWALFSFTFAPNGMIFDGYTQSIVPISGITSIGGITVSSLDNVGLKGVVTENELSSDLLLNLNGNSLIFTRVIYNNKSYFIDGDNLGKQIDFNSEALILFDDLPAINNGIRGSVIGIDGKKVDSYSDLVVIMKDKKPGDNLNIKTRYEGQVNDYEIILGGKEETERGVIGISNSNNPNLNIAESIAFFKEPFTAYVVKNSFFEFIYYLVFWVMLLNILVAFFNMLPVSILDGGRFFYLAVWGLTGSEKTGRFFYKWIGILILLGLVVMMGSWLLGFG